MTKNSQFIFISFVILYFLIHLSTLTINPLPWYDETYNASITTSFVDNGTFLPRVATEVRGKEEDLRYGFVYFLFTGFFFKFFGVGIWQLRIVTLLSALVGLFALHQLLSYYQKKTYLTLLFVALLAIDPYYYRCMHEGRMDSLAAAFMWYAFYFFIRYYHIVFSVKRLLFLFYSSVFFLLAMLTTPRIGFLSPIFLLLACWYERTSFGAFAKTFFYWLMFPLFGYYAWILYAFGGIMEWKAYYLQYVGHYTQVSGFYFYFQRNHYLLMLCSLLSVLVGIFFIKKYFNELTFMSISGIILFYLLVKDPGPYAFFIIPFYYLLIMMPLLVIEKSQKLID